MVATRRGANKAPEAAPAPSNTLNAPPKRGGRKKAVIEEVVEPAPAVTKATKTTAIKRKAKSEPEGAEPPMAKKPAANMRATRAAKVETKAKPAPAGAKRATRGRKAAEPAVVEEPAVIEETQKPAATRGRKATAKKVLAPTVEESATAEESTAEEAPKPASRTSTVKARKAPGSHKIEVLVVEEPIDAEAVKPAPRGRKAAAPKVSAPAPALASRATRGRNVPAPPQESPLKAPARKPTKKAAAVVIKAKPKPVEEPVEEPFALYPGYPTTPAHILAPMSTKDALAALPGYPKTPAHITAPISTKAALAELPDYPKTPAHIVAPMSTRAALAEMPGYPKTPAHIKAPISVLDAMAEMPGYPKTPAHIMAPVAPTATDNEAATDELLDSEEPVDEFPDDQETMDELPDHEETIDELPDKEDAMNELHDYPNTPTHVVAPVASEDAMKELPDYPQTPAHIQTPLSSRKALAELPDYPETPAHIVAPAATTEKLPADGPSTPVQATTPTSEVAVELFDGHQMPEHITWGVTNQEAFAEMPAYPTTPAHITAPISTKQALAELPDYPKTPTHIAAPVSTREALAELPSYPTTPAIAVEAAIQEEITASVKKQTPSPLQFPGLDDVSFQFAETSEYTDVDSMEIDSEAPAAEETPRMPLAPLQLAPTIPAPEPASPKKSALRFPQNVDAKTPKKAVTWEDAERSDLFLGFAPLEGMKFYVDVTSNGKDQNYLFASLLEDLGAKVFKQWTNTNPSHVLYKDGSKSTLEKVLASKGTVKCVNIGWVLDSEKNRMRMDEAPYLVDLSIAMPASPPPTTTLKPFTPARTPSKYALPPSSECRSVPTTPTSSEFDRSINFDDKENCEYGIFFDGLVEPKQARTVPPKKSSFLLSRSPIKTPSKPSFLMNTPVKPVSAMKPFSTSKKRSAESRFPGITMAPPKKLRLF